MSSRTSKQDHKNSLIGEKKKYLGACDYTTLPDPKEDKKQARLV